MSKKRGVVLYLHMHQPWRVREYSVFDIADRHDYFDNFDDKYRSNRFIFEKVADKSYRPMLALLRKLLAAYPDFCVSLSVTGTLLDQAERWAPDVIDLLRDIIATGRVEIVGETYYHSLAFFYSRDEFQRQVDIHRQKIRDLFGVEITAFRNTELSYNNELAEWADQQGYKGIIAEGWDKVLGWRNANYMYRPAGTKNVKLLLKNYRLSDDIAFRFSNRDWESYPLTSPTYVDWVDASMGHDGEIINLFMDFETFGENIWADTGIFEFFADFVERWLRRYNHTFYTISGACQALEAHDEIDCPQTTTWADTERDLSAWLGNSMQHEAMRDLYAMENDVLGSGDLGLIAGWRQLTTSDHPYYMCTKYFNDGDVHAYFSPYDSPYDAFLYFMNALRDVRYRLHEHNIAGY